MKKTNNILPGFSKICIFIVFIFLVIGNFSFVKGQSISWQKIYRNPLSNDAWLQDICPTDSNNFFMVGGVAPFYSYFYVLKINQYGDTLWTKVFDYGGSATSCVSADNGSCVFTGDYGGALSVKMNSIGGIIWEKHYSSGICTSIKKTFDGGFILSSSLTSGFFFNAVLIKIDSQGDSSWMKIYSPNTTTDLYSVIQKYDSGYVMVGARNVAGNYISYIGVTDVNGNLLNENTFNVGVGSELRDITEIEHGIIAAGVTYTAQNSDSARIFLAKITKTGNIVESKILNYGITEDQPKLIIIGPNRLILSNMAVLHGGAVQGFSRVTEIDTNLNFIKQLTLLPDSNSLGIYSCSKVQQSSSSEMIFCGFSDLLHKTAIDGYACRFDTSFTNPPPIGITVHSNQVVSGFRLIQNYPNPFNSATVIGFDVYRTSHISLRIYDCLGRLLKIILDRELTPGHYSKTCLFDDFPSGIYFYQLKSNEYFTETKKMILIK